MERAQKKWLFRLFDAYPKYLTTPPRSFSVLKSLLLEGFVEADLTKKGVELCLLSIAESKAHSENNIINEAYFRITPLGVKALKIKVIPPSNANPHLRQSD
jgi:hypothetical protein